MLPRFHWSDITTVGHYLGVLILVTGAAMFVPAIVALCFGEVHQLGAFIAGIGTCLTVGSAALFLKNRGMDRRRSLLFVGFGWIVIGLVCSVPLLFSGTFDSWFDALFDSVSALTTTGVTLVRDVDSLSYSQITWRAIMSFSGSVMVVVVALLFGFFGEGSKIQIITAKRVNDRTSPRIRQTCITVLSVYGVFAIIGVIVVTIICLTLGLSPVDSFMNGLWLALTAVGTGGFVPHTSDLLYYHSLTLQLALCVLMLVGALSFGVYIYVRMHRYKRVLTNAELRYYLLWIAILVASVVTIMTRDGIFTSLGGFIQNGMVMAVSAATTCGMQSVYPEQIGVSITDGIVIVVILAFILGACAYSTGGGIKFVRILQVLRWVLYSILIRLVPDNARVRIKYEHFGSQSLNARDATVAMTVFILYIATAALGSMVFIAFGNDALNSVFEAISYVSNCGMTTEITQAGLPLPLKIVALLLMWAGRVEFIALIAAVVGILISLHPGNLFSNVRSRNLRLLKHANFGGQAWRSRKGKGSEGRSSKTKDNTKTFIVAALLVASLGCGSVGLPLAQAATSGAQGSAQDAISLHESSEYIPVDIRSLLAAGTRQDNRDVTFVGEAVGSPIRADDQNVWVNLKNAGSMIGVVISNEMASQITNYAGYEQTGDMLTVYGVFNLACADHNGELDVHAMAIQINEYGETWVTTASIWSYAYGIVTVFIGFSVLLIHQVLHGKLRFRRFLRSEKG